MLVPDAMDITEEQTPRTNPSAPEAGAPPKPTPEMGGKPDLINPEMPDEKAPGKPMPDMDPDGQDPVED